MEIHADTRIAMIRTLLQSEQQGMSISDIANRLGLKRNIISGDLNYLLRLGQVEMQTIGTSKVFFAATKIPLSGILNYYPDMVLVIDQNRCIIEANTPVFETTGLTREEVIGCSLDTCPGPLYSTLAGLSTEAAEVQKIVIWLPILDDPRAIRHFTVKQAPIVFEDTSRGTMFIIEDNTEAIRYRDALRVSEERYKGIVEDMSELIFRFFPNGTITYANRAFSRIFGDHENDHRGENVYTYFSGDDQISFLELVRSARGKSSLATGVHAITIPEGTRQYSFSVRAITNEEGRIVEYQGIGRDISVEYEARDQLIRHAGEKEFLCNSAQQFLETGSANEIYEHLARDVAGRIPRAIVIIFSYDENSGTLRSEKIWQTGDTSLSGMIGEEGLVFSLPPGVLAQRPEYEMLLRGKMTVLQTEFFVPLIGDSGVRQIREKIGQGRINAIGMVWDGAIVGLVAICLPQEIPLDNQSLIETLTHIAVLALQRQHTRESLLKSDNLFRTVTAVSPLPVSIINPDGRYLFVNSSFTAMFGYTLDDIPDGRRWFLQAFPDIKVMQHARALWLRDLRQSKQGEIRSRRFSVRCKDGTFCSVMFHPVTLPDGCQLIIYEDVTEREEAERVRNLLAAIVRSSHDAIIGTTTSGRIQTWNPGAERVYGYRADEVLGKDISLIFPPALLGEKEGILSAVQAGDFIPELETRRVRKDGSLIDVSVTVSPVTDCDGTIIGLSTIVKDITARKAAERFRDLESRYRTLVDGINVGVYRSTADPAGRFIWGNSSLIRILGYSSFEDMRDTAISDHFLDTGGRQELLDELRGAGFVRNRELRLRKKDGSILHVMVTALATFAPDGKVSYINGIVEDVTDKWILAQKLASLGEQMGPSPG